MNHRKIIKKVLLEELSKSDCREKSGIAIGLIDGMIANLRVLKRDYADIFNEKNVQEALKDLKDDEDLKWLLDKLK